MQRIHACSVAFATQIICMVVTDGGICYAIIILLYDYYYNHVYRAVP